MFICDPRKIFDKFNKFLGKITVFSLHWLRAVWCFQRLYCFMESSRSVFDLGLTQVDFHGWSSLLREESCVCLEHQQGLSCVCPPCPGRAAHLLPILRLYKHNVFKFWLCSFVWFFCSKGMTEPFMTIICPCCWFPIFQSWLFPWRWMSPWMKGQRSLCSHCRQSSAAVGQPMAVHLWGHLLFQKHHFVSKARNCCPAQVFRDSKVLTKSSGDIVLLPGTQTWTLAFFNVLGEEFQFKL